MSTDRLILKATLFAAEKHKDQRRKGESQIPYVNHVIEVAELLERFQHDTETIIAGLLHDTIEDTATTPEEIEEHFGVEILSVVLEVTDDKSLPKTERKLLQVVNTPKKSDSAKKVKIADKICNLKSIHTAPPENWTLDRQTEYFHWAKQVVDGARGVCPHLEQLFDDVWLAGIRELE